MINTEWFELEDNDEQEENFQIKEYDITAIPNDFNIRTIFDFVDSGVVSIPGFQRNYVWDIRRASKLIESLIIGLPIPQIFLYEESKNKFSVIDGQQRLMSIYYFKKKRFPKENKRQEIRKIVEKTGRISQEILDNNDYFIDFNLKLRSPTQVKSSRLDNLNYETLSEDQSQFDFRTVRNIVIRQNSPNDDDSSIYEIFNRLNSGGVNLTPQEIRGSLYSSNFYIMLDQINQLDSWRDLINLKEPDLHAKDIEILLRCFSMLLYHDEYSPSITRFLNTCSRKFKSIDNTHISYCKNLFISFIESCININKESGKNQFLKNNRFNISTFEAVFVAMAEVPFKNKQLITNKIDKEKIESLKSDNEFTASSLRGTSSKSNISARINKAKSYLS